MHTNSTRCIARHLTGPTCKRPSRGYVRPAYGSPRHAASRLRRPEPGSVPPGGAAIRCARSTAPPSTSWARGPSLDSCRSPAERSLPPMSCWDPARTGILSASPIAEFGTCSSESGSRLVSICTRTGYGISSRSTSSKATALSRSSPISWATARSTSHVCTTPRLPALSLGLCVPVGVGEHDAEPRYPQAGLGGRLLRWRALPASTFQAKVEATDSREQRAEGWHSLHSLHSLPPPRPALSADGLADDPQ